LTDADKPAALAAYAREQGFHLTNEVIDFLLTRGRRDMGALLSTLRALDRYSLSTKRPVTIPLVKELLQPDLLQSADNGITNRR
jgi:DnaA-homolog protein